MTVFRYKPCMQGNGETQAVEADIAHRHSADRKSLTLVFVMTTSFMLVEIFGGVITNSLALLSDAGHMFSDAVSLALSLVALRIAAKARTPQKSYGYHRAEILAALVNGATLVVIAIVIIVEAAGRLRTPPVVQSMPMIAISIVGLAVNLVGAYRLSRGGQESLNKRGAYLHVLGDALGSVGALAAGLIMVTTDWYVADPLISFLIAALILVSSWRLLRQTIHVLMEGTPGRINPSDIEQAIMGIKGVAHIHDMHVWTITSGRDAISVHVVVREGVSVDATERYVSQVRDLIRDRFGIAHSTVQVELERNGSTCGQENE